MADSVPAALRQADINIWKCATKGAQLRTVKPIMAYWCEYWAVNQILAKGLHTTNQEILEYTKTLMDDLEKTKSEYANEAAIADDAAAQAYVEQFAQETLDRAERVIRANRVTQQTATTFDAAATFFHVANVWGPIDQETQQKIKYAKWNAARIIKSIKEGKDPNESNPKREEIPPVEQPVPDAPGAAAPNAPDTAAKRPRPVTVEEVPDADLLRDAAGVSLPHSPTAPSPLSDAGPQLPGVPSHLTQPSQSDVFAPAPSISPVSDHAAHPPPPPPPELPGPPTGLAAPQPASLNPPPTAPAPWSQPPPPASPTHSAASFYRQPPTPPSVPPSNFSTSPPAAPAFSASPPTVPAIPPPIPPNNPYFPSAVSPQNLATPSAHLPSAPPPAAAPVPAPAPVGYSAPPPAPPPQPSRFTTDEANMVQAQKHAKWAISALNFEDVPTAVRELRKALELLGGL